MRWVLKASERWVHWYKFSLMLSIPHRCFHTCFVIVYTQLVDIFFMVVKVSSSGDWYRCEIHHIYDHDLFCLNIYFSYRGCFEVCLLSIGRWRIKMLTSHRKQINGSLLYQWRQIYILKWEGNWSNQYWHENRFSFILSLKSFILNLNFEKIKKR